MFHSEQIELDDNPFDQLFNAIKFEESTKGRLGAVIVDPEKDDIPIVRTTTSYNAPAQRFPKVYHDLVDEIKSSLYIPHLKFNNAMVEVYDKRYRSMGYHCDQSLDLDPNSYICIFSCYDVPQDLRTLRIKSKVTNDFSSIIMNNCSCIIFSVSENSRNLHKIILEKGMSDCRWLGITFRLSKTFVRFQDQIPIMLPLNKELRLATENEKILFYKIRGEENKQIEFTYPKFDFTVSKSDIMRVT